MPIRLRKFIGTILLIVLVLGYALLATTVAVNALGASPWWVHLTYFFLTGLLWILPAMGLIKWMSGPSRDSGRRVNRRISMIAVRRLTGTHLNRK